MQNDGKNSDKNPGRESALKLSEIDKKFEILVCLSILAIGIVFTFTPEAWITFAYASEFVEWVRAHWPKVNSDALAIDKYEPSRGARYVLASIFSVPFFFVCALVTIISTRSRMSFANPLPQFVTVGNLIMFPVAMAVIIYVGFFEQSMAMSDARAARSVFRSVACIFWPPLISGALAICIVRAFGTYSAWFQGRMNGQ